jgi:hypothetical protein
LARAIVDRRIFAARYERPNDVRIVVFDREMERSIAQLVADVDERLTMEERLDRLGRTR